MQWDGNDISLLKMIPHARLSDVLVVRRYSAGAYIFEQNDPTTGLWFVLYGNVAVERIEMDGNLTTTGVWMAGDIVGIAGLWDQSGYPASARAITSPTVMGWILRDTVMRLHVEVPAFGLEVSRLLAERLRFVQESISGRQGRPIIMQVASVVWCRFSRYLAGNVRVFLNFLDRTQTRCGRSLFRIPPGAVGGPESAQPHPCALDHRYRGQKCSSRASTGLPSDQIPATHTRPVKLRLRWPNSVRHNSVDAIKTYGDNDQPDA